MSATDNASRTTILFGAFDRHNFGDLLLPHVIARMIGGSAHPCVHYAGLAERDLTDVGGHRVHALARLAASLGSTTVDIIHVGGEILTCSAWEAAVMLQPPEWAPAIVAKLDARPLQRSAWACEALGLRDAAPYLLPAGMFANVKRVAYHAVGGITLGEVEPAMRDEVLAKLGAATSVGVRDLQTQAVLAADGLGCRLQPDPAVMVAELFGDRIRQHAHQGEVAGLLSRFPHGYFAVQFSADFGDDATLAQFASQLQRVARDRNVGVVLFRAGAAPWHDDMDSYRRVAQQLRGTPVVLFDALNLWDICALLAHSRAFAGSSLHGAIVASAFALPWVGVLRPGQALAHSKQAAFAATWGTAAAPAAVAVSELAAALDNAMAAEPAQRQDLARRPVNAFRTSFTDIHET
ncbi:polysaccharide pyruvyl transferase family protein [Cupriavidus necator]|uniref:polysaccharide pyruvyl transferase family protein n=1 Tax=Cupriavidus necator TaxID=106590 RepID=UPI00339D382D